MIPLQDRQEIAQAIEQAQAAGVRLKPACRWQGLMCAPCNAGSGAKA